MKTEFSNDQYELAYPDGIDNHWWHLARNRILENTVKNLTGPDATVLEVGCGKGIVVKYLRSRGINCTGVELADVKPIAIVEKYIRVRTSAFDISRSERQRYNIILLLDVIEHIPDPVAFLQELVDAFPNLTHVIITVPARQELWSNYDDFYGHYRRYSIDMLKSLSCELHVNGTWEGYFFHSIYPLAWAAANLKKKRETKLTSPHGLAKWVHKLISYAMIFDYRLFPRRVPGTSALACFFIDRNRAQPGAPAEPAKAKR
jgi:SAM-dependent methyltransferase